MSTQQQRTQKQANRVRLGGWGEARAVEYLQRKNYQMWEQNWRRGNDEIDVIAFDEQNQEVVFCEVKTRGGDEWGDPSVNVDRRKLAAQERAARLYLRANKVARGYDYRFDIITVLPDEIEHYENVTWP